MSPQDAAHTTSLTDPSTFWSNQARYIAWSKPPTSTLTQSTKTLSSGTQHSTWQWFPGGELNTCYNCVDRHVEAGNGNAVAIYWHSEVADGKDGRKGRREVLTYARLKEEVEVLAGVLKDMGVGKGDRVVVYMPMIPAAVIAMLACARLGAIHAVVFGGFGPNALAQRIDQSEAKVLLTASCGLEGATKKIAYQPLVRGALELSERKPQKVLIWQRDELRWELDEAKGEVVWESAVKKARRDGVKAECVDVKSEEALYVIYTSGTTGAPKGVVRENGGHAVALSNSIRHTAGLRGPGDVSLAMSDIGWVTGHSYLCYGPLLVGSAVVLYEGKPIGTPDAGILWRLIEEYRINAIFTAPTALRAIRRDDPELKLLKAVGERGGLRSLRTLWLTGERSQPALTSTFQSLLTRYAVPNAIINDNWGLSEQGVPLTATSMLPSPSVPRPGFAGKPQPGMDVHCVDDEGHEVPCGTMGNMVLGLPLSPSSFRTLWRDEERFWGSYLRRFGGRWFDTGDAGVVDDDGYVQILSRSDDVINVAGHRLSTGAIEQSLSTHPSIAECCVVGLPDPLKGHLPFAFAILFPSSTSNADTLFKELNTLVRSQQGSIATLGGMIVLPAGAIPKTRSGKMLRRNLKELVEAAAGGEFEGKVDVPGTIDDPNAIPIARKAIKEYFLRKRQQQQHSSRSKL